jgi:heme/copper-type cytochrome/quinol oxidase subunit 4
MRQKNWRVVIVGIVLVIAALVFFLYMQSIAPKSTDPAALMQTVGTVAGVVCGLALVMIVFGLIGRKVQGGGP